MAAGLGVSLAAHGAVVAGAVWVWSGVGPVVEVGARREAGAVFVIAEEEKRPRDVARVEAAAVEAAQPMPDEPAPIVAQVERSEETVVDTAAKAEPSATGRDESVRWIEVAGRVAISSARISQRVRGQLERAMDALADWGRAPMSVPAELGQAAGDGVVESPTPLAANWPPVYPEECRRRKQEGVVRVRVGVRADGSAESAAVEESSGVEMLDRAAVEAAGTWRFAPAMEWGRAVRADALVTIRFVLGR